MKLIGWSKMPAWGTMTDRGVFLGMCADGEHGTIFAKGTYLISPHIFDLRLVPSKTWLAHDGGECPLPPGLIVEYREFQASTHECISSWDGSERRPSFWGEVFAYRIIGVDKASGWTDDPREVTE